LTAATERASSCETDGDNAPYRGALCERILSKRIVTAALRVTEPVMQNRAPWPPSGASVIPQQLSQPAVAACHDRRQQVYWFDCQGVILMGFGN